MPLQVLIAGVLLLHVSYARAAEISKTISLQWTDYEKFNIHNETVSPFRTFKDAAFQYTKFKNLPFFTLIETVQNPVNVQITLDNEIYESVNKFQHIELIPTSILTEHSIATERKQAKLLISLLPIRKNPQTGLIERLVSFRINIRYTSQFVSTPFYKAGYATTSVLASGAWIKLGITQTGIHAITKNYLRNLGVNVDAIDPRTLKIYGYGAGMLPQLNSTSRYDDLPQNPIVVEGESDGVWNDNERILFFGKAQRDVWNYASGSNRYRHQTNIYSDVSYYFLTFGGNAGLRISTQADPGIPTTQVSQYDQVVVHELELANLIKSGKQWFGEEFNRVNQHSFSVNLGNVNTAEPIIVSSNVVARSFSSSSFTLSVNGAPLLNQSVAPVLANFEKPYASATFTETQLSAASGQLTVSYRYNPIAPGSIGWLDYTEFQSRNFLSQSADQLVFRDARSIAQNAVAQFNISSGLPLDVWDVTTPAKPFRVPSNLNGGTVSFTARADSLREYISFNGITLITPSSATIISNQNLHGLSPTEAYIIAPSRFADFAYELASFHTNRGVTTSVVFTEQIYNEFSSGSQDVSAIRDFLRMLYKRASGPNELPKYLTLLGRASYDYKDRINNNTNLVPTYESFESFDPVNSYNSDDYFGFLDDNEGKWDSPSDSKELLDIAIGRIPVQNEDQARQVLDKIKRYVTQPDFGSWKSNLFFIADDEDFNAHVSQSDDLANRAINSYRDFNVRKIFIDAYKEVSTAGGARNPEAQSEIVRAVEQGAMLINYTGHGGEIGWAEEGILNVDNINSWTNGNKLPLFVTATCEFSRFDDPLRTSAGEYVLLNPNGGGIALFTTVRLVSSYSNFNLNNKLLDYLGLDSASMLAPRRLGEIMRLTKNGYVLGDRNERNFTLLGDPVIFLAYPSYRVNTTHINSQPISNNPDTLKAFSKVTISGEIVGQNQQLLSSFNGVVYPTVFDKISSYRTIANNTESSPYTFLMQNNAVYRGMASVRNGKFSFTFIVPKDISYEIGFGKISYLANNGTLDATGNYQQFIIGKTADSAGLDQIGPEMRVFLNDEKFVYGGLTNENPMLIVKLRDESGINITGRGVGRDLSFILNNDNTNSKSLNDYYNAKLDSYQEGEVRYKIRDLEQGKYLLKTRAFDVYNNASEAVLEFVVATSQELALQHVLNYPNPFTTNTTFHFDHNKAGEPIQVQVQIFTVSGKLIKTLQTEVVTTGNHFDMLSWDGRDDYGDLIGKGAYIYKVKVRSSTGKNAEEFQKLVILN